MKLAEMLEKTTFQGRVLFIGNPLHAVEIAEKLSISELVVATDDQQSLEQAMTSHHALKITPIYTRVIERLVELPSQSFDTIIAIYALEKAVNKRAFMTEARRLLREKGKLFITEKIKSFLRGQGLKKEEFEKLLNTQGYATESLQYRGGEALAVLVKQ
ncbi:MAG: class I SAM-dependent methyltransferase [Candidatus Caldarchaeum sp.]|nr:class I SAM-dependent methyltransferase [Candidatus Caldarchaeum sp.]